MAKKMIIKSDGSKEPFDIGKFRHSLKRAGANEKIIDSLADRITERDDLKSTKDIYKYAFTHLKGYSRPLAAKYNLKNALMKLGPTGFPFESYIAKLYSELGYTTKTNIVVDGKCVTHEMDVIAVKENETVMIEAKFHNRHGLKTDVTDALLMKARFDDIHAQFIHDDKNQKLTCLLVTNTQFTTAAIKYAQCAPLNVLGWAYPKNISLEDMVVKHRLIPITALTHLNKKLMRELIKKGCVLCRDIPNHKNDLSTLGLNDADIDKIVAEAIGVCEL